MDGTLYGHVNSPYICVVVLSTNILTLGALLADTSATKLNTLGKTVDTVQSRQQSCQQETTEPT